MNGLEELWVFKYFLYWEWTGVCWCGVPKGRMYIGEGLMVGNLKGCGLCVCVCWSGRAKDGVYMHMRCSGMDGGAGLEVSSVVLQSV